MSYGTVNTVMAFTGQFKSLWVTNMAYHNSYNLGYNVCLISLEVSKRDVFWNLLSRHSYNERFTKYGYIPHEDIRKAVLSKEKEDYLFGEVEKDLKENSKGKLIVLDETDFSDMSFSLCKL